MPGPFIARRSPGRNRQAGRRMQLKSGGISSPYSRGGPRECGPIRIKCDVCWADARRISGCDYRANRRSVIFREHFIHPKRVAPAAFPGTVQRTGRSSATQRRGAVPQGGLTADRNSAAKRTSAYCFQNSSQRPEDDMHRSTNHGEAQYQYMLLHEFVSGFGTIRS
ncbi:hypothetical protein Ga0080574_TMP2448 [Salipiger abyssi]|uniref:Uncharacterized protein n=1 Tax=Salipiger abyssi TaxID=1250539 RepID=A0A1P8UTS7_9RHOB|nr:hypothetical protein Ga0080574_TMP2448 [Salipiger abyssi]